MKLIVQKYGGSSLASIQDIQRIANYLSQRKHSMNRYIIVVSAMGETTEQLLALAEEISHSPKQRELDMLLSTGERISMSLLSLALAENDIEAVSFTGSQAGIMTTSDHSNAHIIAIKAFRVEEEINKDKIVILAGFQGVCPENKEITTLGRGGSDTTAVAMSAAFKADSCEIFKDVEGIYTANPKYCNKAKRLPLLDYTSLIEMTFWGASVLHQRSLILAKNNNVVLNIGHSKTFKLGTQIMNQVNFEQETPLSINTHDNIIHLSFKSEDLTEGFKSYQKLVDSFHLNSINLLASTYDQHESRFMLTGPLEQIKILTKKSNSLGFKESRHPLTAVTLTFSSPITQKAYFKAATALNLASICIHKFIHSPQSFSFFVSQNDKDKTVDCLHNTFFE